MGENTETENFKFLIDALEKTNNTFRSAFYVFLVVNLSMFTYAINAYVYTIPTIRKQDAFEILKCQLDRQYIPEEAGYSCDDVRKNNHLALGFPANPPPGWQSDTWTHRYEAYEAEELALDNYQIPIIGVSVDRDYFWIINISLGISQYLLLISLSNKINSYMSIVNKQSGSSLIQLQSIVATNSIDFIGRQSSVRETRIAFTFGGWLLQLAIAIPLIVSLFALADDMYITNVIQRNMKFSEIFASILDDEYQRPIFNTLSTIIEILSILLFSRYFIKLNASLRLMLSAYNHAIEKISNIERAQMENESGVAG